MAYYSGISWIFYKLSLYVMHTEYHRSPISWLTLFLKIIYEYLNKPCGSEDLFLEIIYKVLDHCLKMADILGFLTGIRSGQNFYFLLFKLHLWMHKWIQHDEKLLGHSDYTNLATQICKSNHLTRSGTKSN